jgi:hypothetical protein
MFSSQELTFRLVRYMWNESYGVFFREPHEENKVLTIDKKVMTGIGSFQVLKCLVFFSIYMFCFGSTYIQFLVSHGR